MMKKKQPIPKILKIHTKAVYDRLKKETYQEMYSKPCKMEFGFEIANIIPKIFYHYKNGNITKTHSLYGMKPFYFFSQNHHEHDKEARSDIENDIKLHTSWKGDKQWLPPNYKKHYRNNIFLFKKPIVVIYNKYTDEWKGKPVNFLNVNTLLYLCKILHKKYQIIYIRPARNALSSRGYSEDNQVFRDLNEHNLLKKKFPTLILFEELLEKYQQYSFNELQLMVCANCENFISVQGGGSRLCSYFGGKNIIYHQSGKEFKTHQYRDFYPKFSGAKIIVSHNIYQLKQNVWRYMIGYVPMRIFLLKKISDKLFLCVKLPQKIRGYLLRYYKKYFFYHPFIRKLHWNKVYFFHSIKRFFWSVITTWRIWRGSNPGKVVVYSCVTGGYDNVYNTILKSEPYYEKDTHFVLFTDSLAPGNIQRGKITWEIRPLVWKHPTNDRRTSRWHKIHSHMLFPDAQYTVWIDGTQIIRKIFVAHDLVRRYIGKKHIATFRHPQRNCIYREAEKCITLKKDNPTIINIQVKKYRKEGYPHKYGLAETTCIVRRNSPEAANFNTLWWNEIKRHSLRDQLSFNYIVWKTGMWYNVIPGWRTVSIFFTYTSHEKISQSS